MWKSWQTTLAGFGVGFLNLYANGMSPKNAALSIGLAALGTLSKAYNVTGGDSPASDEAANRLRTFRK